MRADLLGIDVAQKICHWVLLDPLTRQRVAQGTVRPRPADLARWLETLRATYPIARAAVEATGGWEAPVLMSFDNQDR